MTPRLIASALTALLFVSLAQAAQADEFSAPQRGEIERIVREYLVSHPEVLQEAMTELEKRQTAAEAEKHAIGGQAARAGAVFFAARGRARQSRTATSPSSSSSITTAAIASMP